MKSLILVVFAALTLGACASNQYGAVPPQGGQSQAAQTQGPVYDRETLALAQQTEAGDGVGCRVLAARMYPDIRRKAATRGAVTGLLSCGAAAGAAALLAEGAGYGNVGELAAYMCGATGLTTAITVGAGNYYSLADAREATRVHCMAYGGPSAYGMPPLE